MKLFVRSIVCAKDTRSNKTQRVRSEYSEHIDPLDLSEFKYAEIYKTEVSFDKNTSALYPTEATSGCAACELSTVLFNNVNSDQTINGISIKKGFYTLQELMSVINSAGSLLISLITTEENAYHCKLSSQVDFSNARELQEILGFDNVIASGVSNHPVDITRGLNVLQIYSSIVNSDTDTPICTIKIDDPTKDFHDCLYTNCPIITTPINYIDIVFRNIHGEVVELNAENINVTLFIRAYNEVESLEASIERAFNITTGIDKLEGGKFTKQLDNSMCLTDGKVVNANFLLDGKINNLSSDQTIELDGVRYTIPAGCYELQELLARLNALSSAVFSYISSGEDCYKLTISGCEKISCSDELANMLGLEGISKGEEVETIRYQLTEEANMFLYKNEHASYYIPIATGIYTEKVFFKKVEDAIKPYTNDITITDCGNYWQLNKGEIFPADGTYASRSINKYYWSSAINHRKEGDNSIIPKVGCFYFDEEVTFTHCLEYFEINNHSDKKEYTITANFTDKNNTPIDSLEFDLTPYMGVKTKAHQFLKDFGAFFSTYIKTSLHRSHMYLQTHDSNHMIAFTGSPTFIRAFHLPTSPKQWFDMYIDNTYHKGELIDFRGYSLFIELQGYEPINIHMNSKCKIRDYLSNIRANSIPFLKEKSGINTLNFMLYVTPFGAALLPNLALRDSGLKYKFSGTIIDSGLLQGFHTDYDCIDIYAYPNFSNFKTHQLNLGYTNLEGFKTGLQQVYESKENSTTVLPSLGYNVSDYGELRVHNYNAMSGVILQEDSVLKYLGKDVGGRHRVPLYDENWFYPPSADIEVTADNYQVIISKPSGEEQIINIPLGWYTKESLFEKLNSYLEHPFTRKETYWVLDYCPNKLEYNLEIDFLMMSSEVRVYYPNNKVIESFMLKGSYPVNITNGFNLVNVFTNIIETSANTDNYLTSFVIDRTTGKNVSAAGVKYNYANSSKPINRVIAESNINNIDYYFTREDGQPFNINGKINCTLEIVE